MPHRKLTVLGDSCAEGRGGVVRADGTFTGFVVHMAQALGVADGVLNLGSFGATTRDAVDHQLSVALDNPAPLMGVIVGGNDLVTDYDRDRFERNLRHVYTSLVQPGRLVFTTSWPGIPDRLPGLDGPTRALLRARFAEANEFLEKLVFELDLVCLDLANAPLATDPVMWCADGMHPSPAGHQAIGIAMADLIDEALTYRT
ncbi:GDSL-type esterase/lipase family protein [Amycolatopsis sp. GM8]|uniref:GDSL-type esterase/lipase family protein n=1 Tax=Amycolatopsis sp. GM8 TaxID=2896530 RepID=UPI001F28180B|nr:GDSL-type esterase/lipase family protein [Amycolatopsis sp. GM8]